MSEKVKKTAKAVLGGGSVAIGTIGVITGSFFGRVAAIVVGMIRS